jgi:hypothetical protein
MAEKRRKKKWSKQLRCDQCPEADADADADAAHPHKRISVHD